MKAVFFDFDGTIFDSAPYWEKALKETLLERNVPYPGILFSTTKTLGVVGASEWMVDAFSLKDRPSDLAEFWRKRMEENYVSIIPLKKNAKAFLQALAKTDLTVCLATAMDRDYVLEALKREGADGLFDYIITTPELGCDKRGPDIYLHCADRYGLKPEECMVFEDAFEAASACKDAGFYVTGIYDGIGRKEFDKIQSICDYSFEYFPLSPDFIPVL